MIFWSRGARRRRQSLSRVTFSSDLFRHCALYKQQMSLSLLVTGALASSNNVTYWFGSR